MLSDILLLGLTAMGAPETAECGALQAAYGAAVERMDRVYPAKLDRSKARSLDLGRFTPNYRASLPLSSAELDALARRVPPMPPQGYLPACAWRGVAAAAPSHGISDVTVTFQPPVLAEDGKLALVEVGFYGGPRAAHGKLCVARRRAAGWTARCLTSWLS